MIKSPKGGDFINADEKKLINEFHLIAKKRWIKSISKSFGSVGITFEKELNKKADDLYFPDYYGIELKCTNRYSRYPLFLFTIAFDGPTFPEINRIIEKYGYYDKNHLTKKILFTKLNCINKTIVNNKYKFKLEIDKTKEKLYLCVYDLNENIIEKKSFVYLSSIHNHLTLKLSELAIIYASKKKIENKTFFRYYKLELYKLISFEKFIQLLELGEIDVSIIARTGINHKREEKYQNKNLVFQIKKNNIEKLFKKIYTYNHDKK